MGYFPIVSRNSMQMEGLHHRDLPKAYMEDFSVLGFQVDDCERALRVLERSSFDLKQSHGSALLKIKGPAGLVAAMRVLQDNGLACEVADVAHGMYQG